MQVLAAPPHGEDLNVPQSVLHATLRESLDHLQEGIAVFGPDDRLMFFNTTYKQIFGTVADMIRPGILFEDLIRAAAERGQNIETQRKSEDWVQRRLHAHRNPAGTFEHHFTDGRVVWVKEHQTGDGRTISTYVDITDLKLREQELSRRTEELKAHSRELKRSNEDLERFAYVASHDLQEPVRMVSSYCELLRRRYEGQLDDDADEFIAFAVDGARRMQQLISDLLNYARVDSQGRALEPTDMEAVFRAVRRTLTAAIDEAGGTVTTDPLPVVLGDATQLQQLLQNLIANAMKYCGARPPEVYVGARREDDGWTFSVRDNGIGLAPRYSERIFQIFQRLHGRDEYPGTGVGLAICKKIVERHGGRIWVESAEGRGSTFYFTLPGKGEPVR